jgi:hypothetical protein
VRRTRARVDLGLVQLPAGGEEAAVLVAVRIAEHDFLLVAARGDERAIGGQGEQALHDRRAVAQVADRFEQRDDVHRQRRRWPVASPRFQQAGFLQQQRDFEQVGGAVGLRNDRVGQRGGAVAGAQFARGEEDGEFALRFLGVVDVRRVERARAGDLLGEQRDARVFASAA